MAKPFEVISRRAFVLGVTSIGITFGLSCCASGAVGDAGVTWDVQRDDGMPQLRQKAADGSVVAALQDGWAACDGYIQLQLGSGSIPGIKIRSATGKNSDTVAVALDPGDGVSTRDLIWGEWRMTAPVGIDVASVRSVTIDYGDGNAVELDELLPGDDSADPNGRPVA